jgi:hypothetical protein
MIRPAARNHVELAGLRIARRSAAVDFGGGGFLGVQD